MVAHAEALKSVQDLKKRLTQSQTTARESRAAAETAQAKLTSSEASWQQQREALDKEIADLKTRYVDISHVRSMTETQSGTGAKTLASRTVSFTSTSNLSARTLLASSKRRAQLLRTLKRSSLLLMTRSLRSSALLSRTCARRRRSSSFNSSSESRKTHDSRPRSTISHKALNRPARHSRK